MRRYRSRRILGYLRKTERAWILTSPLTESLLPVPGSFNLYQHEGEPELGQRLFGSTGRD